MVERLTSIAKQRTALLALVLTGLFMLVYNGVATPLLNSDDDAFFLYTLSGSYGETPSHLLHYDNAWNPLAGWVVQQLFLAFPTLNWYTIFLFVLHVAGCTAITFVFLKKFRLNLALLLSLIFFVFMEARLLLYFTYTAATLVSAIGGATLLLYVYQEEHLKKRQVVIAVGLLLASGLLRFQVTALVCFLFLPVMLTILPKQKWVRLLALFAVIGALLFAGNKAQEHYYRQHIANWQQQENFRQGMFYAYNRQLRTDVPANLFRDSVEQLQYIQGFLYDTQQFTPQRVNEIGKAITRNRSLLNKADREGLYWFAIEMAPYFFLFVLAAITLIVLRQMTALKRWLGSLALIIAFHCWLFVFLKITMALYLGLIMILWISLVLQTDERAVKNSIRKTNAIAGAVMLIALFGWIGKRWSAENSINQSRRAGFYCAMMELRNAPDQLFLATDNSFPIDDFYIWDNPRDYPATNIIYKERMLTQMYPHTLKRFGFGKLEEAMQNNARLLFLGDPRALVKDRTTTGPLPGYRCLQVYRLVPLQ